MKDNNQKKDKNETLLKYEQENKELKKEIEDFKNKYLRALADYQNFQKRISEEKKDWEKKIKNQFFLKLLPFLDNLEKAELFIKDPGLKLIKDQFFQLLRNEGVEEIDLLGKKFDPNLAEAIDVVEGEKENIVVEVLRKGYRIGEQVLRVAQVKVSVKKEKNKEIKELKKDN